MHREEGGTPAIVESIRAGLVFQLKEAVGADAIREREERLHPRDRGRGAHNPNIEILGNPDAERLSIVSFVVRQPGGRHLHHNFVVALLNDLFGIQSRGGCSCAGPYGHRLLGIDLETLARVRARDRARLRGHQAGWSRVNFNYFIAEEVFRYLIEAVAPDREHQGWRLLPDYASIPTTGLARTATPRPAGAAPERGALRRGRTMSCPMATRRRLRRPLADYLDEARKILEALPRSPDDADDTTARVSRTAR